MGFVGDGSNDSLALKSANIGLSIGNLDSSFSASFYTQKTDLKTIKDIIIEGKVCLSNAIQNFKYFMTLNILIVYIIFVMTLYDYDFPLFDYMTMFAYGFPLAFFLSKSKTIEKLTFLKLEPSILNKRFMIQFFLPITLSFLIIFIIIKYVSIQLPNKLYYEITHEFLTDNFSYSNHYFYEAKYCFIVWPLSCVSMAFIHYEGRPLKE